MKKRTGHRKVIPAAIVRKPVVLAATALLVALAVTLAATGTLAAQTVVATITVGANPHGIAVDPANNRIYVANNGTNTVSVIDSRTNNVIDTILVGASPDGVGFSPVTNRIYVVF